MAKRPDELQRFLDCTEQAILARAVAASPELAATTRIFSALRRTEGTPGTAAPVRLPVCAQLARGFALARVAPPPVAALGEALAKIEPLLAWQRRHTAKPGDEPFYSGHANASVVGRGGLEERSDVLIGVSLMAPNVVYPDHNHPPEEVYVSLAAGQWRNADTPWTELGQGGLFYNPPGIIHAMRTGGDPLLAVWCLWAG